jgi:hypothetical protein
MKKWDMLMIDVAYGNAKIWSTDTKEAMGIAEIVVKGAPTYFSSADPLRKFDINMNILYSSNKGHEVTVRYEPYTEHHFEKKKVYDVDFKCFLLNVIIARNWLPYPGDGEGKRFIRYSE